MENINHPETPVETVIQDPGEAMSPAAVREHPWWTLCLALDDGDPQRASKRLQSWRDSGIPAEEEAAILQVQRKREEEWDPASYNRLSTPLDCVRLDCFGTSLLDWQAHAWLQRMELPKGFEVTDAETAPRIGLNLEVLTHWFAHPAALEALSRLTALWDPDPDRVVVLRACGVRARLLHAGLPCNGWLERGRDPQNAMVRLGVPHPRSLVGEEAVLILGQAEASEVQPWIQGIHEWPEFDAVQLPDPDSARLLAHWLEHCSRIGIQIVRLKPTPREQHCQGFLSLSLGGKPHQMVCQFFHGDLHLEVLRDELTWRRNGRPAPAPIATRTTEPMLVWKTGRFTPAKASVCISLYNYEAKITTALESVKAQSQPGIELIVVDDASTDRSLETVHGWLQDNYLGFHRVMLIQHRSNAGLAAARNKAFEMAASPWCFVLDADNHLHPQAVEQCLNVAADVAADIAVIHPLILRRCDGAATAQRRSLVSGMSWQQHQFRRTNYIDAMALIRRSAWLAVGGYSHIEDGWEDYDFWCKLMDHGYQGVLCPQVLATYVNHDQSMIHNRTDRHVRRISRLLQSRHPWLDLPMARLDA